MFAFPDPLADAPKVIKGFPGREVDFFLRIHSHLPDRNCGDSFPFGSCKYSDDGEPINAQNDYVDKLRSNPAFCEHEERIQKRQTEWQLNHHE